MKKLFEKMKVMREGATLVTVVIATAFLITIGVVILAASTRYLASVYMDRNTNENMYSAEGILAEVRTGLLEYAGDAGVTTYKEIMEDYEKYKGKAGSEFGKRFICRVAGKLQGRAQYKLNDIDIYYDVKDGAKNTAEPSHNMKKRVSLKQLRALTTIGAPEDDDYDGQKANPVTSLLNFNTRIGNPTDGTDVTDIGDVVDSTQDIYFVIHFSPTRGYYLIIKNLVIDNLDESNYRTAIQTDIQINAPDYKFEGGKSLDEARDYIVIADGLMDVDGTNDEFNGNIYTGGGIDPIAAASDSTNSVLNTGTDEDGNEIKTIGANYDKPGIRVNFNSYTKDQIVKFNSDKIISRGSMEIYKGANVTIKGYGSTESIAGKKSSDAIPGDVYLKNIKLLSKTPNESDTDEVVNKINAGNDDVLQHTELTLETNSYIENDLDIKDTNSVVNLGGKYYGYSYNKDNVAATIKEYDSRYSSAILVNGYNTTLNTDNKLLKLNLAGRAFVERSKGPNEHNDIITGQSIAVRSDQIAYLVPDRIMKTGHNPVTRSECEGADAKAVFTEPETMIDEEYRENDFAKLKELFSDSEGTFLCEGVDIDGYPPVTGDYREIPPASGDPDDKGEGYAYVFLNFKNEKRANDFFKYFYTDNKDPDNEDITASELMDRARPYISSKDPSDTTKPFGVKIDPALYLLAGNIIRSYNSGGALSESNYYDGTSATPSVELLEECNGIGRRYMNFITKLTAGDMTNITSTRFEDLSAKDQAPMVAGQILDLSVIPSLPSIPISGEGSRTEGKTGAKIVCGTSSGLMVNQAYGGKLDTDPDTVKDKVLIINKGNVEINTDSTHGLAGLIICDGNVTIEGDAMFDGLIMASGTVTTKNNVTLSSDYATVGALFDYIQNDPDLCKLLGRAQQLTDNDKEIEKCIRYLDWQKNTY